jgi:hypothetical protein
MLTSLSKETILIHEVMQRCKLTLTLDNLKNYRHLMCKKKRVALLTSNPHLE